MCCNTYTGVRRSWHSQFTSIHFSSSMHSGVLLFSCTASIHFPHIVMPAALAYCKVCCNTDVCRLRHSQLNSVRTIMVQIVTSCCSRISRGGCLQIMALSIQFASIHFRSSVYSHVLLPLYIAPIHSPCAVTSCRPAYCGTCCNTGVCRLQCSHFNYYHESLEQS